MWAFILTALGGLVVDAAVSYLLLRRLLILYEGDIRDLYRVIRRREREWYHEKDVLMQKLEIAQQRERMANACLPKRDPTAKKVER